MTSRWWRELTTLEAGALRDRDCVAILPMAATEQHGPHLPLGVDAFINHGVLERAVALAPADLNFVVLPASEIGKSNEHLDFAGTLTLTAETLIRVVTEIATGVERVGLRKIVLFNSHGGQPQIADIVAQDLRARLRMIAVPVNSWRLMRADDMFDATEIRYGLHGGAVETSIMMHLRPDLVRRAELRDFPSSAAAIERDFPHLAPDGRVRFAWQAQDLNREGATGNAAAADAEKGRALVDRAARGLIDILRDLNHLPPTVPA